MSDIRLSTADLYVEVFLQRGNVSLFEAIDPDDPSHRVELDVWSMRAAPDEYWALLFEVESAILAAGRPPQQVASVTRYPDLEKDMKNVPYHPSVPAWKIDPLRVKEHFNG